MRQDEIKDEPIDDMLPPFDPRWPAIILQEQIRMLEIAGWLNSVNRTSDDQWTLDDDIQSLVG